MVTKTKRTKAHLVNNDEVAVNWKTLLALVCMIYFIHLYWFTQHKAALLVDKVTSCGRLHFALTHSLWEKSGSDLDVNTVRVNHCLLMIVHVL